MIDVRDHHDKPYVREKAAAVLKVAGPPDESGESARQVALNGLLRERQPDTVRRWVHVYKEEGIAGFVVEDGRGQKPAFSPDGRSSDAREAERAGPSVASGAGD